MFKFTGESKDGRRSFYLGLSRDDINQITTGHPIKVHLRDMGGPDVHVAILFGETERMLFDELKSRHLIPPELGFHEAEIGTTEVARTKQEPPFHYDMQRRCLTRCQSDDDGDCVWTDCPQNRDGEPAKTGRHCPLDSGENRQEGE